MTTRDAPVRIEDLLAHRQWVRGLAIALTRDPADADDVEQQTWLAALRRPPRHGGSLRGWLGTVVRNAVRERGRSAARRGRREAARARGEADDSDDPSDLTARAELHARVAAAVVALDEPYRRAILLRHFEEVPVTEVARRMGTPLETARARLRRGRLRLRDALQADVGDTRPLALVLLPLTRGQATGMTTAAVAAGGALVTGKLVGAATAVLLLLGLGAWWMSAASSQPGGNEPGGDEPVVAAVEEAPPPRTVGVSGDESGAASRVREHVDPAPASAAPGEEPPPVPAETGATDPDVSPPVSVPTKTVAERLEVSVGELVLDNASIEDVVARISWLTEAPIDVDIRLVGDLRQKRTSLNIQGAAARMALDLVSTVAGLDVRVEDERVVLHRAGEEWRDDLRVQRIEPQEPPAEAAPVLVRGRVVDASGGGIEGAILAGLPDVVRSGPGGVFSCELRPVTVSIVARKNGYVPSQPVTLRPPFSGDVVVELGPLAASIHVAVTGTDGQPIRGALVRTRRSDGTGDMLRTRDDGVAMFEQSPAGEQSVVALARGYGRVVVPVDAPAGEATRLTIVLPRRTLAERLAAERTTMVIDHEPLSQVVARLYPLWDVGVRMDAEVPHEITSRVLDLRIDDDSLEGALRAICNAAGATFRVEEERDMVWIEGQ